MANRTPAEVFSPGEFIADELEARGWSQLELAEILGRPPRLISQLITGKCAIKPETAKGLGAAFGTGPEVWMNLERDYRLANAAHDDEAVQRRARLYTKAPVKEMINRGWIEPSDNISVLETRVFDFLHISKVDDVPQLAHAARKRAPYNDVTASQWAWLFRVVELARAVSAPQYSRNKLLDAMRKMERLLLEPEKAQQIPQVLADCGIRLIFVERLQHANIDGACVWLDEASPTIGMSLRRDRIDNFWFVLRHELEHVLRGDGKDGALIEDLERETAGPGSRPSRERVANAAASNFCVPSDRLENFMKRKHPFYYETDVVAFSQNVQRHPGLVIGQLQFRLNDYKYLAKRMAGYKIRQHVLSSATYDGWGYTMRPNESK